MERVIHLLLGTKAPRNKVTTSELRTRAVAAASYRGQIVPALVAAAGDRAGLRFLEFFAAGIRNPHTRRAYARAVAIPRLVRGGRRAVARRRAAAALATWIEMQTRELARRPRSSPRGDPAPFDWLVIGQVVPANPAASVRGPAHIVDAGKTPVLDPAEARQLLDSIDVTTPAGLRDRALIALMVYKSLALNSPSALTSARVPDQHAILPKLIGMRHM